MHAAIPRIGIQGTKFSEHEVFGDCRHFSLSIFLRKNVKIMKKLSVLLITKYIICTIFYLVTL